MTVEATSADQVLTQSCPTRTCAGLCDECAATACLAAGELAAACERLVANCSDSCSCGPGAGQVGNCGFPVCTTDRNLCYIGDGLPAALPVDPSPDPDPENPVIRPSGESPSGSPSSSGSNAAQPAG
jgi:hypothetical protein